MNRFALLAVVGAMGMLAACSSDEESGAAGANTGGTAGTSGSSGAAGTSGSSGTAGAAGSAGSGPGGSGGCEAHLPTFAEGKTPAARVYVQAGAAASGDGSQGSPFNSVQAALAVASPGTEVRIDGQLSGSAYVQGVVGTSEAPIWITGEPGARVGPLALESAAYVVLQDLEMAGPTEGHVLHFYFSNHILMRRLRIHDAGLGCIKGSQTTHAYVEDSELWEAGQVSSHPIIDFVGVNTGHIVRSEFHRGPGVMVMLKGGTSDLLFAWNRIFDQTAAGNALSLGQSTGPQYFQPIDSAFEGERIVAFGNLIHDLLGAPFAFEGCKDCAALHNTAWNVSGGQLIRFLPGAAGAESGATVSRSEGCRFAGNIVVGGQESGASLNADASNIGPNNVVDYNVILKPGSLNWWGDIPQDTLHSTYDEDPELSSDGVPGNVALVDGKGPPDVGSLPFAESFVRDALGRCVDVPLDVGAVAVP